MKRGFAGIAIVGVAAVVAVFAFSQGPANSINLHKSDKAFARYLAEHGKSYTTKAEYAFRKALFDDRVEDIMLHNSVNGLSWTRAVNKFTDMTEDEAEKYLGGGIFGQHRPHVEVIPHSSVSNGPVDWRGQMNAVKDQGQCGSCWAFAAIGSLEGRYAVKHGSKVVLSEQQLVDCATRCNGCGGGWSSVALQYIQSAGGSQSSASYPYHARRGSCRFNAGAVQARVSGVSGVGDAKSALAGGPVAVYLQANSQFMSYGGGIFNGVCGQYNHAVTLVGWGSAGGVEYWIIRNSWGGRWGEAGHIRVKINGNCRITFDSFPVVA
jgi:hypothetical protein